MLNNNSGKFQNCKKSSHLQKIIWEVSIITQS